MTSDSENKFKFSSTRENRTTNRFSSSTTPLQPAASNIIAITTEPPGKVVVQTTTTKTPATLSSLSSSSATVTATKLPLEACAAHQLRCVSGKCITVDQLCDKVSSGER